MWLCTEWPSRALPAFLFWTLKTDQRIVGMVSLNDLLRARTRNLEDERARERVLRVRMPFGRQTKSRKVPLTEGSDFKE